MQDIIDVLVELRDRRVRHAVATVVEQVGSVSAKTGAKAVIDHSGHVIAGWVGGGCAESTVCQTALDCMRDGETRVVDLDLDDEVLGTGMPCGGSMRVYVEPRLPNPRLWILGHGRIAECICEMGATLGFEVVVMDPMADEERFPAAARRIADDYDYSGLKPVPDDFVVIATQHKGDHQSIKRALSLKAGYIALIASKKRAGLVLDFLEEEGFQGEDMTRVFAPAGLDLGCRSPEEIALSVLSEIVAVRRGGTGSPMREIFARQRAGKSSVALAAAS